MKAQIARVLVRNWTLEPDHGVRQKELGLWAQGAPMALLGCASGAWHKGKEIRVLDVGG